MEITWCWRCRQDIPMLDEEEWERFEPLLVDCIEQLKRRQDRTASAFLNAKQVASEPVIDRYRELTGHTHANIDDIWHHRRSIYGPPCKLCGKALRTPVASKCFECGEPAPSVSKD